MATGANDTDHPHRQSGPYSTQRAQHGALIGGLQMRLLRVELSLRLAYLVFKERHLSVKIFKDGGHSADVTTG